MIKIKQWILIVELVLKSFHVKLEAIQRIHSSSQKCRHAYLSWHMDMKKGNSLAHHFSTAEILNARST